MLSVLSKGLEFFIQEYENNSYRNEKFLFWHPEIGAFKYVGVQDRALKLYRYPDTVEAPLIGSKKKL